MMMTVVAVVDVPVHRVDVSAPFGSRFGCLISVGICCGDALSSPQELFN